jgi:uncharacterized protein with von Willebrand factor type A (vWA) domain
MMTPDSQELLIEVLLRMREAGTVLGIGELLSALEAAAGERTLQNLDELKQIARLLWCKSSMEAFELERAWAAAVARQSRPNPPLTAQPLDAANVPRSDKPPPSQPLIAHSPVPEGGLQSENATPEPIFRGLPILAPSPATRETAELQAYWPVSRRFMAYSWRYLRRPVRDGPEDVLDLDATVDQTAKRGFFLSPVFRPRERNHAHLLLLIDQDGSMVPFHRFTRDLVETSREDSNLQQVDIFYFHNVVAERLYVDPRLTQPVDTAEVLSSCSADTSVLIVSDAGAARGYLRTKRITATMEFVAKFQYRTALLTWLNPMPRERWPDNSAHFIARLIPMFQMTAEELSSAVDVLRGHQMA